MTILKKNFFADFLKKRSIEFLVIYIIGKAGHSTFRICNQLNWLFSKMKIFFKRTVDTQKKICIERCKKIILQCWSSVISSVISGSGSV